VSDDDTLLRRARTHPDALGDLYERHAVAVHRYLARRAGTEAADDLLAEVFVAALGARKRVVPHASGSALPWLYGIAANTLRAHLRRGRLMAPTQDRDVVDWDAVDDRLDAGARRSELRSALATLTPSERELLLLVAWEGLTPTEAATALGLTPVAARSRLHRARTRAQAALEALAPST
jgi:RNA polymerase sigma factor (sigma-70 family)